jgi:hypothetical protein
MQHDGSANLWLDAAPVLAVSVWETFVALTLADRLVLVRTADYEQFIGYPCPIQHGNGRQ